MNKLKFDWVDIIANKRPVMLRNGTKAYIIADLRDYPETGQFNSSFYHIRGFMIDDNNEHSWRVDGKYHSTSADSEHDIISLWKETVNVSIPRPLKEPREKMWYITGYGDVLASGGKNNYDSEKLEAGFYFATKDDAEEFLKVLHENRG